MPNTLGHIHSLNLLLRKIDTHQKLIDAYREACPDALTNYAGGPLKSEDELRHALDYCSGAAKFVIGYLTGSNDLFKGLYEKMSKAARELNGETAEGFLNQIKTSQATYYIGLLNAKDGGEGDGHECVFVRTGFSWAFYQANGAGNFGSGKNFTLAPKLNPQRRNWCINDMGEKMFDRFFMSLTNAVYCGKLFSFCRQELTRWRLSVFSFYEVNLIPELPLVPKPVVPKSVQRRSLSRVPPPPPPVLLPAPMPVTS
jgi:hypothetical protein